MPDALQNISKYSGLHTEQRRRADTRERAAHQIWRAVLAGGSGGAAGGRHLAASAATRARRHPAVEGGAADDWKVATGVVATSDGETLRVLAAAGEM